MIDCRVVVGGAIVYQPLELLFHHLPYRCLSVMICMCVRARVGWCVDNRVQAVLHRQVA